MDSKAIIKTERDGDTLIVTAGYWTPEWVRFTETTWWPIAVAGWVALSILAWRWLDESGHTGSFNEAMLWGGIGCAGAYALSWSASRVLMRTGGGYGLSPMGSAKLIVRLSRERIVWEGLRRGAIDREGWHVRFIPRPHRRGRDEERDAISDRGSHPVSYAYREAWEIWLQAGERFFALAAVSNEADADAIVRRLQACDLEVTRPRDKRRTA